MESLRFIYKKLSVPGFVLIAVLWLTACNLPAGATASQAQTFEQAAELVLETVVRPESSIDRPIIVFGLQNVLQTGDVIQPYNFFGEEPIPNLREIEGETWFFWIDGAPRGLFAHPNRFVFVSRGSGQISVMEEEWWPMLNGENLWPTDEEYSDPDNWIYSNITFEESGDVSTPAASIGLYKLASPSSPQQEENPQQALVLNLYTEGQLLEKFLNDSAGQMEERLRSSGFDTTYLGPATDANPQKSGIPGNPNSFLTKDQPWVKWLTERAASMKSGSTMVLYINGHGVNLEGEGYVGGSIRGARNFVLESELKEQLAKFDPGVTIIVNIDACKSGCFMDGLKDVSDLTLLSSEGTSGSYADIDGQYYLDNGKGAKRDRNPDDKGLEFTSSLVEVWNQIEGQPVRKQKLEQWAEKNGFTYWEALFLELFTLSRRYNITQRLKWTEPKISIGSPKTKPAIAPTSTLTPTVAITPTPTITLTPTPEAESGTVKVANAFGRYGPSKAFLNEYDLKEGQKLTLLGRYGSWLLVKPEGFETSTWISGNLVETDIDKSSLPVANWDATLPFTSFAPLPTNVTANRMADGTVEICWAPPGIAGDDPRPDLIVLNVWQNTIFRQLFMNDTNDCVSLPVDPGSDSMATIYIGHQRGYGQGLGVLLP